MIVTADAVVFRGEKILCIRRGKPPFQNRPALPGGHWNPGETIQQTCLRELKEETGLIGRIIGLIGVYSEPGRDPRGDYLSVAFLVEAEGKAVAGDDAREIGWYVPGEIISELAFDHGSIIRDAIEMKIKEMFA